MAEPIDLIITNAGLDALVDAQNGDTDAIQVVEVGISETAFDPAPTLDALPGEVKRIASVAGQSVAENIIHMSAQDATTDIYDLRGLGLYLADGTLFATYAQADPLFSKVSIATFLLAFDVRFSGDIAGDITFGDASFLYPPATETVQGVAELATQGEVDAGTDDERIVTPLKLETKLGPVIAALQQAVTDEGSTRAGADAALQDLITALRAIQITGTGLATGGGALTANRQINVAGATLADMIAAAAGKVITADILSGLGRSLTANSGYVIVPGTGGLMLQWVLGSTDGTGSEPSKSVLFPTSFPTAVLLAFVSTRIASASAFSDVWYQIVGTPSASAVTVQRQFPSSSADSISTAPLIFAIGY